MTEAEFDEGDDHRSDDDQGDRVESIEGVMEKFAEETQGEEQVQVQDILDAFAGRLFGPVILLPALIAVTPLGAIPLVPTIVGSFIVLIAVQRLFGRKHPWMPKAIRERGVKREKMTGAFDRFKPWARRVDRLIRPRLSWLVEGPMEYAIAGVVVLLGCLMPPLELIPFAVFLPAGAVLMLGLALTARDGVVAIIGLVLSVAALGTLGYWLLF